MLAPHERFFTGGHLCQDGASVQWNKQLLQVPSEPPWEIENHQSEI